MDTTAGGLADCFDLFDRALARFIADGDTVVMEFDLFHCDDPQRSDESAWYSLEVCAPRGDITVDPPGLAITDNSIWGEIIEADLRKNHLALVIMLVAPGQSNAGIVYLTIAGDRLTVKEHPPTPTA